MDDIKKRKLTPLRRAFFFCICYIAGADIRSQWGVSWSSYLMHTKICAFTGQSAMRPILSKGRKGCLRRIYTLVRMKFKISHADG